MLEKITVSAAMVTYNSKQKSTDAAVSILNNTKKYGLSLTVYDNASNDGTAQALRNLKGVKVVDTGANLGFGKAHNVALNYYMGKYHAVINPDIIVNDDVISALVDVLENNPDIVMITPKILNSDGSIQHLPKRDPTFKYLYLGRLSKIFKCFSKIRNEYTRTDISQTQMSDIDFCTGCFFVIRSDVFQKLSGFDDNFFMYMEDADLTRRAKRIGRVVYYPLVSVTHLWERESAKSLKYLFIHLKSSFYYFKKWRKEKKR